MDTIINGDNNTVTADEVTINGSMNEMNISGDGGVTVTGDNNDVTVNQAFGVPVFTDLADLPTDGSIVTAVFKPEFGLRSGDSFFSQITLKWDGFLTGSKSNNVVPLPLNLAGKTGNIIQLLEAESFPIIATVSTTETDPIAVCADLNSQQDFVEFRAEDDPPGVLIHALGRHGDDLGLSGQLFLDLNLDIPFGGIGTSVRFVTLASQAGEFPPPALGNFPFVDPVLPRGWLPDF